MLSFWFSRRHTSDRVLPFSILGAMQTPWQRSLLDWRRTPRVFSCWWGWWRPPWSPRCEVHASGLIKSIHFGIMCTISSAKIHFVSIEVLGLRTFSVMQSRRSDCSINLGINWFLLWRYMRFAQTTAMEGRPTAGSYYILLLPSPSLSDSESRLCWTVREVIAHSPGRTDNKRPSLSLSLIPLSLAKRPRVRICMRDNLTLIELFFSQLHIIRGVVQSSSSETRGERPQTELIRAYSLSITNEHRVALESLFESCKLHF